MKRTVRVTLIIIWLMFCTLKKKKKHFLYLHSDFKYIYIYSSRAVPFLMSGVIFSLSMCNIGKNGTAFISSPLSAPVTCLGEDLFSRKPTDKHATVCLKPTCLELEISVVMLRSESWTLFTLRVHVERVRLVLLQPPVEANLFLCYHFNTLLFIQDNLVFLLINNS